MTLRRCIKTVVVLVVLGCGLAWLASVVKREQHGLWYRKVECLIKQIGRQRPPGISDKQWAQCILHTWNLHTNYGGRFDWNAESRNRFIKEFRERLREQDGLKTINWFWDAYIAAVPRGHRYLRYRPTTLYWMKEAESMNYDVRQWGTAIPDRDCAALEPDATE